MKTRTKGQRRCGQDWQHEWEAVCPDAGGPFMACKKCGDVRDMEDGNIEETADPGDFADDRDPELVGFDG